MEGQGPPWAARGVMGLLGQARVRSTWRCGRGRRGGARGAHQTRRRWPGRLQPGSYSQPFCGGRQPCLGWASAGESEHVWVRGGRHKAEIKASAVFLCPPPRNTDKTRSSHRQPRSQVFRIWKQISRHARSRVAPSRSPFYLTIFDPAQVFDESCSTKYPARNSPCRLVQPCVCSVFPSCSGRATRVPFSIDACSLVVRSIDSSLTLSFSHTQLSLALSMSEATLSFARHTD